MSELKKIRNGEKGRPDKPSTSVTKNVQKGRTPTGKESWEKEPRKTTSYLRKQQRGE